ncbi:hypothetical protein D3C72_1305310 [compost metagenome]
MQHLRLGIALACFVQRLGQHLPLLLHAHAIQQVDLAGHVFQACGLLAGLLCPLHEMTVQPQLRVQAQLLHLRHGDGQADEPRLHALQLRQRQFVLRRIGLQLLPGRRIQVTLELAAILAGSDLHHLAGHLRRLQFLWRHFEQHALRGFECLLDVSRQRIVLWLQQVEGTQQVQACISLPGDLPQQRYRRLARRRVGWRIARDGQRADGAGNEKNGTAQQQFHQHVQPSPSGR